VEGEGVRGKAAVKNAISDSGPVGGEGGIGEGLVSGKGQQKKPMSSVQKKAKKRASTGKPDRGGRGWCVQ